MCREPEVIRCPKCGEPIWYPKFPDVDVAQTILPVDENATDGSDLTHHSEYANELDEGHQSPPKPGGWYD